MPPTLLDAARSNTTSRGVMTADRYLSLDPRGASKEAVQAAGEKLTFLGETKMLEQTVRPYDGNEDLLLKRHCIVSNGQKDRDTDILRPAGARFNTKVLLWNHDMSLPIGPVWGGMAHEKAVECDFGICDVFNGLGRDAATLVRVGALQVSHGFDPDEVRPGKGRGTRFEIDDYEVYEVSLVSVPANSGAGPTGEAVMDLYSDGKFASEWCQKWAKGLIGARSTAVKVPADVKAAELKTIELEPFGLDKDGSLKPIGDEEQKSASQVSPRLNKEASMHTCPECGHEFGSAKHGDDSPDEKPGHKPGGMADKTAESPAVKARDHSTDPPPTADPFFESLGL